MPEAPRQVLRSLSIPLPILNSLTKYPSIPTYHVLGERGRLTEERVATVPAALNERIYLTEKIDGTNARIVLDEAGDYVIGSREHLLYAKGDRIGDPAQGIVAALRDLADTLSGWRCSPGFPVMVLYCEVYGGRVTAGSKHYTAAGTTGARLFDVAYIAGEALRLPSADAASAWREAGGPLWDPDPSAPGFDRVPMVGTVQACELPVSVQDMHEFLSRYSTTGAALDGPGGACEGLVLRNADRSFIAKARHEDYNRTVRATFR